MCQQSFKFVMAASAMLWCCSLAGCGSPGPKLGTVSGTVTLDGKPVPDAKVEFQPDGGGSPSYGTTDAGGRYELMYTHDKAGAMVGHHSVRITTGRTITDPDGEALDIPETLPARYHRDTELSADVQAGSNSGTDFKLTSKN